MRTGLFLFLLSLCISSRAQTLPLIDYDSLFQRRMAVLSPVQRLVWAEKYAVFLIEHSRFGEARTLLQASLKVAQQAHLTAWTARFYELSGSVEETNGNLVRSVDFFLQALAIYQATYAFEQQQKLCVHLISVFTSFQDLAKRQVYSRQAATLQREYRQLSILPFMYADKADDFVIAGKLDSALAYGRKAMTILWVTRKWQQFYGYLDGYGVLSTDGGMYREAEKTFRQCLTYSLQQGDQRRELYAYIHLPEPLLHLGQLGEAEHYAKLALSRIELDPERQDEHRTQVYESLTHIAEAGGQFKQALAYERLSNQYRNAVRSVEKNRQIAEVEARYQTAQKQTRINQLSIDNQRQLTQISWQAAGLIALIALLALALWQYRVIRQANARLRASSQLVSENNRQISQQSDRLGVLMQELHHRVKNNLAIVSSLMRMQSRRLDDPRAVQAVQDGQRRVEAISLIHQQFYQTENLADVPIKAYVTELTENLLLGYGFDPDTFDCQVEVADIHLDVDVAVPLGLVLNEVLTNAFKYAYTNVAKPKLNVRLQPVTDGPATGLLVEVQDNGPGLDGPGLDGTDARLERSADAGASPTVSWRKGSFGQRLIRELTGQLGGEMSLTTRNGTYFRLWIPTPAGTGAANPGRD
ncbi:sensor histidine kinase [Spirosoma soli]|uniref:histidine kinase n=1 Tax=Spirosoma soli TaxID=1770529 RepID=A0ABW5MB88_9BACT